MVCVCVLLAGGLKVHVFLYVGVPGELYDVCECDFTSQ